MNLSLAPLHDRLQAANRGTFMLLVLLEIVVILGAGWLLLLSREVEAIQQSGILGYEDSVQRLQLAEQRLAELKELEQSYEAVSQERLSQLEPVLPIGLEPPSVISNIQSFADSTGLEILSIDVVVPEPVAGAQPEVVTNAGLPEFSNPDIRTATITLNVDSQEGSYGELKRFLDTLENFVPVYDLRTISYVPDTTSFALQLETYFVADPTAANANEPLTAPNNEAGL
jgi:hypothetical protein